MFANSERISLLLEVMHKMVIYQFENLILQNIHFIWHRHFWTITGNAKSFGWTHKEVWLEVRNYRVSTERGCCSEAKSKDKGWLFGLGLGAKLTTWSYFQKVDVLAPSSHRWASPPSTAPEKASALEMKNKMKYVSQMMIITTQMYCTVILCSSLLV